MALTDTDRIQYDWLPKATNYKGNQSDIVFFIINVKTLFGVDLNYPGMIGALNKAFEVAKSKVPVDTGITRNSFKGRKIDDYSVYYFFDPADVIGKVRKKQIVKEYYVKYIAESAKNFNWLSIVMYYFYETLFSEVRKLFNAKDLYQEDHFINKFDLHSFIELFNAEKCEKKRDWLLKANLSDICGAVNGARTRDLKLGKLPLYQLSYYRVMCSPKIFCSVQWRYLPPR